MKSLKQVRRKERDAVFFFVKENFSLLPMKKCLFNEAEMFVLIIFSRNTEETRDLEVVFAII